MSKYDDLRARIRGPVIPIVTPFLENGDLDHDSLHSYTEFLVDAKAPVALLTVGTSRYNLLSDDEMKAVNATVAKSAGSDTLIVVAGPGPNHGSTRQNIEFAQHAQSIGADAILLVYPERWYSDEAIIKFFNDVANSVDIGIMIHAVAMRDGFGGVDAKRYLDADLLEEIAKNDKIIGIKEENGSRPIFEEIRSRLNDKLPIIGAGGAMRRFIGEQAQGSYTYLVGIGSFNPKLANEFFEAAMSGDTAKAEAITVKNEDPYFQFAVKRGWHRALKETMHQLGLIPPFEREPFNRISEAERKELNAVLKQCGWLEPNK